jgi:DNA replication protein DnaC
VLIEPREILIGDEVRYSPGKCPCRIAEQKRLEQAKIRAEILEAQSRNTYTWLGSKWAMTAMRQKTFENFKAERQQEGYESAMLYAANPEGTLALHGTFGTGKTHLLAAVCNKSLYNAKPTYSLFTTAPMLFGAIQERIGHNEDYYPLIDRAIQTPLLVIDDVDKAKWTEFREEIYFSIVDRRVQSGRPMAISTNRLSDLASFVGGAVCSRLKIGQIDVEMAGSDYREEL